MVETTITLDSPITEEQWDIIQDVDFDHTNRIWFHTKHGKDVEFVKQKMGKWINHWIAPREDMLVFKCDQCGKISNGRHNFCPNCGADMREDTDD